MNSASNTHDEKPYGKAFKKVKELKRLYSHIAWFIPGTLIILLAEPTITRELARSVVSNQDILNVVSLNIRLIPAIWLLVILIEAICLYANRLKKILRFGKPGFLKLWEERQIEKFLGEEEPTDSKSPRP